MSARNKVGTQLLVSPHIKARGQALALVRHESVAEIWRTVIEGRTLAALEKQHETELSTVRLAFDALGIEWQNGVDYMLTHKIKLNADNTLPQEITPEALAA